MVIFSYFDKSIIRIHLLFNLNLIYDDVADVK